MKKVDQSQAVAGIHRGDANSPLLQRKIGTPSQVVPGIDAAVETLIPFRDARTAFPGGKRLSLATLHRWRLHGVRGTRLETILVGGMRYVSREAISRFIERQNADENAVPGITLAQRNRQAEAAQKELARAGV
ncbi:MAG: DUF1580 domain-containing protein [Planctomycetaceae bacterium]